MKALPCLPSWSAVAVFAVAADAHPLARLGCPRVRVPVGMRPTVGGLELVHEDTGEKLGIAANAQVAAEFKQFFRG